VLGEGVRAAVLNDLARLPANLAGDYLGPHYREGEARYNYAGREYKEADALLGEELGVGGYGVVLAHDALLGAGLGPDLRDGLGVVSVGEYPRPHKVHSHPADGQDLRQKAHTSTTRSENDGQR
jgi:hypothetical protein